MSGIFSAGTMAAISIDAEEQYNIMWERECSANITRCRQHKDTWQVMGFPYWTCVANTKIVFLSAIMLVLAVFSVEGDLSDDEEAVPLSPDGEPLDDIDNEGHHVDDHGDYPTLTSRQHSRDSLVSDSHTEFSTSTFTSSSLSRSNLDLSDRDRPRSTERRPTRPSGRGISHDRSHRRDVMAINARRTLSLRCNEAQPVTNDCGAPVELTHISASVTTDRNGDNNTEQLSLGNGMLAETALGCDPQSVCTCSNGRPNTVIPEPHNVHHKAAKYIDQVQPEDTYSVSSACTSGSVEHATNYHAYVNSAMEEDLFSQS